MGGDKCEAMVLRAVAKLARGIDKGVMWVVLAKVVGGEGWQCAGKG